MNQPHMGSRTPLIELHGDGVPSEREEHALVVGRKRKDSEEQDEEGNGEGGSPGDGGLPPAKDDEIDYALYFKGSRTGVLRVPRDLSMGEIGVIEDQIAVMKRRAKLGEEDSPM